MAPHYKGSENPGNSEYIHSFKNENNEVVIIKPKALDITWGNDPRYWRFDDSESAELIQVCWLEVRGSINLNLLNPNTAYKLQFKLQLKPDAFGWKQSPVYFMAKVDNTDKPIWKSVDLSQNINSGNAVQVPNDENALTFKVGNKIGDGKLVFGLYEVWRGRWKGGMVIEEVIISKT